MQTPGTLITAIAISVTAAALLMGCGGGGGKKDETPTQPQATGAATSTQEPTPPGPTPPAIDACALLTTDEVAAALDEDVAAPEPVPASSFEASAGLTVTATTCNFNSATTAHFVDVHIWSANSGDAAGLKSVIQDIVCSGKEAVPGLGEVACWYDSNHTELQVLQGTTYLDLRADTGGDATQALQTLAQSALGRLS